MPRDVTAGTCIKDLKAEYSGWWAVSSLVAIRWRWSRGSFWARTSLSVNTGRLKNTSMMEVSVLEVFVTLHSLASFTAQARECLDIPNVATVMFR